MIKAGFPSSLTFGETDLLQLDVSVGETWAYSLERLTYIEKFLSRDNSTSAKMIFPVIFFNSAHRSRKTCHYIQQTLQRPFLSV